MPGRIDIRNATVVTLVVQARWCDDAVAVLERREGRRACRVGPPHLALELRTRAIAAVLAHHSPLLLGGIGRHRIFDGAGRRLGRGGARQHPGHADGGDETRATKKLTPCGGKCEHALPALADFQGGFSLRNAFADPTERLIDWSSFFIIALGIYGRHNSSPFRWRANNRTPTRRIRSPCCAFAASGHAAAAPPTAASNSRRPMVTVIRPSRARCVRERYHATSLLSLTAPHPARAQRRSPRAGDGSDRLSAHGD